MDGEERILSLVALDDQGRKFTNCTAVNPDFSIKGAVRSAVCLNKFPINSD